MAADHPVFRQVANGAHPDLTVLELPRDAKTGRQKSEIPVAAVRDAIERLHVTGVGSGFRVVLVDPAEAMNANAANALLKLLEEPPPRAVLLLVSHRPSAVLPTLRSRCARLRLLPLSADAAAAALLRLEPTLEPVTAALLADFADGRIGRALALHATGELDLYRRVLGVLADTRAGAAKLDGLADDLARMAAGHGLARVASLLQTLPARAVRQAQGRLPSVGPADEARLLEAWRGGRPLDRCAALWDNAARLARAADALHLDAGHVIRRLLGEFAAAPA
jgi:DNA polymerase-3 subunit delta'